jgi:hypothetical protein
MTYEYLDIQLSAQAAGKQPENARENRPYADSANDDHRKRVYVRYLTDDRDG